jgi:two-component system sensor histidine kinase KdpD
MRAISALEVEAREADALRQVDQLKDEFIGGISHELRRPLAAIKGYTASLLLPDSHWEPDVQREFLEVIDEESDHLALLIDNLLDLARLGSGSLALTLEPLDLPALSEQIVQRVRAHSPLPPHEYRLSFPEDFPYVEGDHARMSQLLMNLLENAAKYSPRGAPVRVEVAGQRDDVLISVIDAGVGIDAEELPWLFERFYRSPRVRDHVPGTGLGLTLCKEVVEAHGGRIWAENNPGGGSAFRFTLPCLKGRTT